MTLFITSSAAGATNGINLAYKNGEAYQHARETLSNALQAGATQIEIGVSEPLFVAIGKAALMVADNGCGMSPTQLPAFFTSLGEGGKDVDVDKNFGVGSKASLLPWNKFGLPIVSWTPVNPEGAMIWVHQDETTGAYGLRDWGNGEYVVTPGWDPLVGINWADAKPAFIGDHGTMFVMMGNSLTEDTVQGDRSRNEEGARKVGGYLNERFLDIPAGTVIRMNNLQSGYDRTCKSKSKTREIVSVTGRKARIHSRQVHGVRHFIPDTADSGIVENLDDHGTWAEWYLLDSKPSKNDYGCAPMICVDYGGETYDRTRGASYYAQLGVTHSTVAQRLYVIFHPPVHHPDVNNFGVVTNQSRSALQMSDGTPLPTRKWMSAFYDNRPSAIIAAVNAVTQNNPFRIDQDRIAEVVGVIKPIMAGILELKRGTDIGGGVIKRRVGGKPRKLGGPTRSPKSTRTHAHGGGTDGITGNHPVRVGAGNDRQGIVIDVDAPPPPQVKFVYGDGFPEEEKHFACYVRNEHCCYINEGHQAWLVLLDRYRAMYPRCDHTIEEIMKIAYGEDLMSKVYQILTFLDSSHGYSESEVFDVALSAVGLTAAMAGVLTNEKRIISMAGAKRLVRTSA